MSNQKYLSHYGILGMKWGVRRQPGPDGLVGNSRGRAIKEWGSEAGKLMKTSLRHPNMVSEAKNESIKAEPTIGNKVRRTLLYENTDNLKDVNARVATKLRTHQEERLAKIKARQTATAAKKAAKNTGPSNSQLREVRRKVFNDEYDRLAKESGYKEKQEELFNFGRRNGLNLDDGGGGSRAAGRKYERMQDDLMDLDDRINTLAMRAESKYMVDTYGEKRLASLTRSDNIAAVAFVASIAAIAAAPVIIPSALGALAFK